MSVKNENIIKEAIYSPKMAYITGTKLRGGIELNETKLNYQVAEAIMTLGEVDGFGIGTASVMLDGMLPMEIKEPMDVDGYVYEKDDVVIYIQYHTKTRQITQLYLNKEETEIEPHYLLQSLILMELKLDITGLELVENVKEVLSYGAISEEDIEAKTFASLTNTFLKMIETGNLNPLHIKVEKDLIVNFEDEIDEFEFPIRSEIQVEVEVEVEEQEEENQISFDLVEEEKKQPEESKENAIKLPTRELTPSLVAEMIQKAIKGGITPKEIAKSAGVSLSTVYKLQSDKKDSVRIKNLKKIADFLENKVFEQTTESTLETQEPINVQTKPKVQEEKVATKESEQPVVTQSQMIIQEETIDIEKLKKERPRFYEDDWVKDYLADFELKDGLLEMVLKYKQLQRSQVPDSAVMDVEPKPLYLGYSKPLERALVAMLTDNNLLIKGHAGTAKTALIQTVSCILGKPLYTINGSDESNIETMIGFKDIENGSIVVRDGRLVKAMKNSGIIYLDEANMTRPNIIAIMNAAIDHRKEIYNEFTGERIKGKRNFRFMGAINEGYEGTKKMNEATKDRSVALVMKYMTYNQLIKLLSKFEFDVTEFEAEFLNLNNVSETDIYMLADIAVALQTGVKNGDIEPVVASTRNIINLMKLTRIYTFEEAIPMIVQKYSADEIPDIGAYLKTVKGLHITPEDIKSWCE